MQLRTALTFDGPAGTPPDPAVWTTREGRWNLGSRELQNYTPDGNVALDGVGRLAVTARREPSGTAQFSSGRIDTRGKLTVGINSHVRASIKLPAGEGILPAFWMMGDVELDWPDRGEIDIMESPLMVGEPVRRNWLPTGVHSRLTGKPKGWASMGHTARPVGPGGPIDLTADFHTYAVSWLPGRFLFFLDNQIVHEVTQSAYEAEGNDWTPFLGNWPMHLLLNVAVGGNFSGPPVETSPFPQSMLVESVEIYSL